MMKFATAPLLLALALSGTAMAGDKKKDSSKAKPTATLVRPTPAPATPTTIARPAPVPQMTRSATPAPSRANPTPTWSPPAWSPPTHRPVDPSPPARAPSHNNYTGDEIPWDDRYRSPPTVTRTPEPRTPSPPVRPPPTRPPNYHVPSVPTVERPTQYAPTSERPTTAPRTPSFDRPAAPSFDRPTAEPRTPPSFDRPPARTPFGNDVQHNDLGDKPFDPVVEYGALPPADTPPRVTVIPRPGDDDDEPAGTLTPWPSGEADAPGDSGGSGTVVLGRPPASTPPTTSPPGTGSYDRPPRHTHEHRCHGYSWDHFAVFYPRASYGPTYHGVRYTDPDRHSGGHIRVRSETEWSVSAGVTALHSAYVNSSGDGITGAWSDPGAGLAVRFKPAPVIGFELGLIRYSDSFGAASERDHTAGQASIELYLAPEAVVTPYILGGGTVMGRDVRDDYRDGNELGHYEASSAIAAGHAGVGIEFRPGERWFVDIEGVYLGYAGGYRDAPALPGAIQTTAAVGHRF